MERLRYFIEPLDLLFLRGNKLFGDPGSFGESLVRPGRQSQREHFDPRCSRIEDTTSRPSRSARLPATRSSAHRRIPAPSW